jgi:putative ubiquitin-RnfH superfamily antitoxin RatB of RatAB toxin-antitoxin module
MKVEVVDARPEGAQVVSVELPAGATLRHALAASGFELDLGKQAFGIFGRRAALDRALAEGDRVEIYRPLALDPKEARRRRATRRKEAQKRANSRR